MVKKYRTSAFIISCFLVITAIFSGVVTSIADDATDIKKVKNVIVMIPDGTGISHISLARWYNGGGPLAMDEFACGMVRTYWAGGPITDSAPAASAMATGYKTTNKYISILPKEQTMPGIEKIKPEDSLKPVATVLEAAKLAGKSTGLVATANVQHATPAGFSSHTQDRNSYTVIAEQQVYNGVDVMLGGGNQYLTASKRPDKEDMIKVLKDRGYTVVKNKKDMQSATANKLWGLFAEDAMANDIDRNKDIQPSLAEMTQKAVDTLSQDSDGFFLMVEGSRVDWSSHANDPVGVVTELLAFDKAVQVALDFAKKNGDTAVVIAPDHGNGGLSIGNTSSGYDSMKLSAILTTLKKAKLTANAIPGKLNKSKSNLKDILSKYYGLTGLKTAELKELAKKTPADLESSIGSLLSKRCSLGWTSGGHSGEDVPLFIYHPNNYRATGVIQNTDIAKYIEEVLGLNLAELNTKLFIDVEAGFAKKGAAIDFDFDTDPESPIAIVKKDGNTLSIPANKSIVTLNGQVIEVDAVSVCTDKFFVSQQVLDLIK